MSEHESNPQPEQPQPVPEQEQQPVPGLAGSDAAPYDPGLPGAGEPTWGGPPPAGSPAYGPPAWEQPTWGTPPPEQVRSQRTPGRNVLVVAGVVGLMAISAVGGGVAGAVVYAQSDGGGGAGSEVTRVVDAPQLDYTSLASIASEVTPSVVSILIGQSSGSGVVMSDEGFILTNAHVVEAATPDTEVLVRFSNGETAQAAVVGADARTDIAVIQVEGIADLTPAQFGRSSDVLVGDTVLAVGSPLGFDGSVTQGIISAVDRTLQPEEAGEPSLSGLLQTDAAINRGNSGGALVNLAGEVIGINTAIAVENQRDGFLGVGFAIPSDRAINVAEQLIAGEDVSHAFLGVRVGTAEDGGALIGLVDPGSPAEEAGLQEGDIVTRLGDRAISDANDLVSAVQSAEVGDTLELEFMRDGTTQTTTVTLVDAGD